MTDPVPAAPIVLVVDDDPTNRRLFRLALERAGLTVDEASSGAEAIERIARDPVGVVISDLMMPSMTGIQLVENLRRQPDTARLPFLLVTGSGDEQTVISGLDAGATDFLAKPVRLDELVARVRAHLRTHAAWIDVVQQELLIRAGVAETLASVEVSSDPEQTAEAVVQVLSRQTDSVFVSVVELTADQRMHELATYARGTGVRRGGASLPVDLATYLATRAKEGPWVEDARRGHHNRRTSALLSADPDLVASAPIHAGDELVGVLSIGVLVDASESAIARRARTLASAIDYARILSAFAGSAIFGRLVSATQRNALERIITGRAFHAVFQPIVDVETLGIVGYEGLTRFDDKVPPDTRFKEAVRVGLDVELEVATIQAILEEAVALPAHAYVSINLSPSVLLKAGDRLRELTMAFARPLVVELTEHAPIDDYAAVRAAIDGLGGQVGLAVDDAGAGYASLRHILELESGFAKLDISLVRGIDGDTLRQALAAGLNHFALRTGCRLVAEGVETQAEADTLRDLGIEYAQGYLYGRPAPAATLTGS